MERKLKNRHIQMIALGSAIGTGLFFGSKDTIKLAGPGVLAAYAVCGLITYIIVRALAEMSVHKPVSGSFSAYAYEYWSPAAGFASGWNYWFNYVIVSMAELVAVGKYIQFWLPSVPCWLSALVCLAALAIVNIINVGLFGETEYWLSGIKVTAILALIFFGAGLLLFSTGVSTGAHNLLGHGGFFPNGLRGFLLSLAVIVFSFGGTELIGITAGEAENPQEVLPKAANNIVARIIIFYLGSTFIILTLFPWNALDSLQSPYVEVFSAIGLPAAANILNFVVITAALSAFNGALYTNSRMLYSLSAQGAAPRFFSKLTKRSIPLNAIIFSSAISLLAVLLIYVAPEQAFLHIVAVATAAALVNWIMILVTHNRFKNWQKLNKTGPSLFPLPYYRQLSVICYVFFTAVFILMWFTPGMRETVLIAPIWLLLLLIAWKIKKSKA